MTLQIDRRSKTHRGNGIATTFPYDFPIPSADTVRVWLFDETTNTRMDLSSAQYAITGLGEDTFGVVIYPLVGTPIPATTTLTIARQVPYTQEMDIQNQGGFYPEVLEDQLDLMVMQIQQVASEGRGALRAQEGEEFEPLPPKSQLAGKVLGFDSTGEPREMVAIPMGSAVFATEAEARAGTSTNTLMSPFTTFAAIQERSNVLLPEDFIADPLDIGSVTAGLQAFFDTLATEGGTGRLNKWYPINAGIVVPSVAQPFVIEGEGRYVSGLRRAGAAGFNVLDITGDDFVLRDFGLDGARTTFASSGMHGLRVRGNRWQARNLYARDCSGAGILGTVVSGTTLFGSVRDCHVDGTGGAQFGVSLNAQINATISGCFVENVYNSTSNVGINLAGCSNSALVNCSVRNTFTSAQIANGTAGVGSNNQIDGLIVTSPNSTSSSGSNATGVNLIAGSALSCDGLSIDGGNQDGFIGVSVANAPDGGAAVTMRASNCAGAGSYVLRIQDAKYSLVTIESVFNVNTKFVQLVGTQAKNNTVLLGRKEGTPIYAPWVHVDDTANDLTNLVQLLSGDITQQVVLDDDAAVSLQLVDGIMGLLEVTAAGTDETFRGTAVFKTTSPLIFGTVGAACAVGTGALATGASGGTDGKLNVNAAADKLFIKNRMGSPRTVLFRLTMA